MKENYILLKFIYMSLDYKIDKLPNAAYDLRDERQAAYFSHARENMKTDIAHIIMYANQQIYD